MFLFLVLFMCFAVLRCFVGFLDIDCLIRGWFVLVFLDSCLGVDIVCFVIRGLSVLF